jgi:hypothetical protein
MPTDEHEAFDEVINAGNTQRNRGLRTIIVVVAIVGVLLAIMTVPAKVSFHVGQTLQVGPVIGKDANQRTILIELYGEVVPVITSSVYVFPSAGDAICVQKDSSIIGIKRYSVWPMSFCRSTK